MFHSLRTSRWFGLVVLTGSFVLVGTLSAGKKLPLKSPKFDPTAEQIDLFDGIEQGLIDAVLIPKDALGGNLFFENKTDKPLTIKMPKAVVAVQVLKQFGGGAGGLGGGGRGAGGRQGGMGGGMGGMGGGMGGGQMMGGGMGGMGGGMGGMGGGMGGMGMGMMSVPPERVVQVPFKSVCLEHGKPEPHSTFTYKLAKVETFSSDPVLKEALELYVESNMDPKAAQAAMWSVASKMSWQELAAKHYRHAGGRIGDTYFTQDQILIGQQLIAKAQSQVREKVNQSNPAAPVETPTKLGAK